MPSIFCCSSISPCRQQRLDHEAKFDAFVQWGSHQTTIARGDGTSLVKSAPYAIQLVRQVNYGPLESIRYFVPASNDSDFAEATEDDLLKLNFDKVNSYLIISLHKRDISANYSTHVGTRTSSVKSITNSSKSTCIRKTLSMRIIGGSISHDRPETLI